MKKAKKPVQKTVGILLASAVAVTALSTAPQLAGYSPVKLAWADPVRVDAPQTPNFADVVEAVTPAVVSVRVESDLRPVSNNGFRFDRREFWGGDDNRIPPFFRNNPFFYDDDNSDRGEKRSERRSKRRHGEGVPRRYGMSQGSGFFVSDDGYIVTNHHVVSNGSKFTVVTDDGTEYDAELVGADSRTDLAVLKIDADKEFTYVSFADDPVKVGEWVVAVGNPFGLGGTVTAGIVSAHKRAIRSSRYDDFIQIDAAVNRGNSGGPAFNLNGEVIGINNQILSPSGGNVGIAFAIPAATGKEIVSDLIENGSVVRGWLGVQIQPVTTDIAESVGLEEDAGAIVTVPQEDSPAAEAGIRAGDVITEVDGKTIKNPRQLARLIGGYQPEEMVNVTVWRDGEFQEIEVTLGKLAETAEMPKSDDEKMKSGELGLALESNEDGGVTVVEVMPDSSAADKGLREGDIITSVNGEEVKKPEDVAKIVREAEELGRKATLFQIGRGDETRFVAIPFKRG
ncbi:MAG: Do family serine endopeptidase [Rhizobiaceae bacterium]